MTEPGHSKSSELETSKAEWSVRVIYGVLAAVALTAAVILAHRTLLALPAPYLATIIEQHGPVLIGIPMAIAVAFFLVAAVRAVEGPIRFEILGLKSSGAGAVVIVWIATFVAITMAIRALW